MKKIIGTILTGIAVAILIYNCKKDKNVTLNISGKLICSSECKSLKSASLKNDTPDSLSCINYSFDESDNKLLIKHINAGFNCCHDSLYCIVTVSFDTIIIQEYEVAPKCNCDCLFDLNIEINGVESKKYNVKFIEPYVGDQDKLIFGIDLATNKEGSFCVTRKQYPWGLNFILLGGK